VKPEATEYSKSGTDDGAAKQMDAAFDPSETSPEGEKQTAGEGDGVSFAGVEDASLFVWLLCWLFDFILSFLERGEEGVCVCLISWRLSISLSLLFFAGGYEGYD